MPKKNNPGCNCCDTGCRVALDDRFVRADSTTIGGPWTEVDAVWAIASNQLVASGAGTVTATAGDADDRYAIEAEVEMPTVGDKFRVIVGRLDASNFAYAEMEHISTGTNNTYRLRTYKVQGGTHTLLDQGPHFSAGSYTASGNTIPTFRIRVCWRGDHQRIAAQVYGTRTTGPNPLDPDVIYTTADGAFYAQCETVPITGSYGPNIGLQAAVVGTVARVRFVKVYDLSTPANTDTTALKPDCPFCDNSCTACIDGYAANTFSVTISGSTNVPNGTYLFPTAFNLGQCGGNGGCGFGCTTVFGFDFLTNSWRIRMTLTNFAGAYTFATAYSTTKFDCRNLSAYALSPVVGAVTPNGTCTVTSV